MKKNPQGKGKKVQDLLALISEFPGALEGEKDISLLGGE